MLLGGDADGENLLAGDPSGIQGRMGGLLEGCQPVARLLLAAAIGIADQAVAGTALTQHPTAVGIQHQRLAALGAAIDP
ncbi:hypothetical protein D3C84_1250380 [compost metagenome]